MLQPLLFWSSLSLASHFVGPSATSADANDRQSKSCNIHYYRGQILGYSDRIRAFSRSRFEKTLILYILIIRPNESRNK